MTNDKMSKNSAVWAAFIVGSLTVPAVTLSAFGQTTQPGSSIPELEIRNSSDRLYPDISQNDQQNTENLEPVVLGNSTVQNTGRRSNGLSQDRESQSDDPLGVASQNGRQQRRNVETEADTTANNFGRQGRAQAAGPVGIDPDDPTSSTLANDAVDPVQTGTAATEEDDPFGATGLRLGTYDVQLSLEQSVGYSSNVSRNAGGEDGGFSQTDVDVSFTSDWSRHEWQTNFSGSFRRPFDNEEIDEPSFTADTRLRLDLIDGVTLTGSAFYTARTQEFTDTTLAPGAVDTPLEENFGGSLELERSDRKFVYALRGSIQNSQFEDADLGGGATVSQEDQGNTLYSIGLRTGYEVSPAVTPFVEGIYSVREFDLEVDRNGNRRDSDTYELRAGIEVDLGEKVQGELAVGYINETFEDPLLEDLSGFTVNGILNWSPERDSLVTLTFGTQTNNSITANDNGSLIYNARIDYERQVTSRFSFDAYAGVEIETNEADNTTYEMGIGTQYWINRYMALTSDLEYERFSSDTPGSDFDEVSGRIGIRLQR